MEERLAQRKKNFKKNVDADDIRRRRENDSIQIRKQDKDEQLNRRRRLTDDLDNITTDSQTSSSTTFNLPEILNQMKSGSPDAMRDATYSIRKMLSIAKNPPIQDVLECQDMFNVLVQFLDANNDTKLQFEAAWAITNIASGNSDQTRVVVNSGCIEKFVNLLSSPSQEVCEQAVWALGNIAGDSVNFRNLIIEKGGLTNLIRIVTTTENIESNLSFLRNVCWAFSNMVRGKPQPDLTSISPVIPVLAKLITLDDSDLLSDACWAISYISDGPNSRIEKVLESGVCPRLVSLLDHPSSAVLTPALRAVGNFVTGEDHQTQAAIDAGCIQKFAHLLKSTRKSIRKETCWAVSNITAGTVEQIISVVQNGLIPAVMEALMGQEFEVAKEAAWVISNACSQDHMDIIVYLVEQGAIEGMCKLLTSQDSKIHQICLEALDHILSTGQKKSEQEQLNGNPWTRLVEECDGLTIIENLQASGSEKVYSLALNLLESYFDVDENGDDDQMQIPTNFNF